MTTTVAAIEMKVSGAAQHRLKFSVEFDATTAVVRRRPKPSPDQVDEVVAIEHDRGRLQRVNWNEGARRSLAPTIRTELIGRVLQLLKEQLRPNGPET
jgi:hypothetical protein